MRQIVDASIGDLDGPSREFILAQNAAALSARRVYMDENACANFTLTCVALHVNHGTDGLQITQYILVCHSVIQVIRCCNLMIYDCTRYATS